MTETVLFLDELPNALDNPETGAAVARMAYNMIEDRRVTNHILGETASEAGYTFIEANPFEPGSLSAELFDLIEAEKAALFGKGGEERPIEIDEGNNRTVVLVPSLIDSAALHRLIANRFAGQDVEIVACEEGDIRGHYGAVVIDDALAVEAMIRRMEKVCLEPAQHQQEAGWWHKFDRKRRW